MAQDPKAEAAPSAPVADPAPAPADKAAVKAHHAAQRRMTAPWWASRLPTFRGWVYIGVALLTWRFAEAIISNPRLLAVASFMQLFGSLLTGGLLLIVLRLFPDKSGDDHKPTDGAK